MTTELFSNLDHSFNNTRVLVTGASGFTGAVLTRKLVEAGALVSAIARDSSDIEELMDLDITWHRGDVFDENLIKQACEGVQYIFHLAAAFREEKSTEEDFRKVHLYSTQLLAKQALDQKDFKRFIHVSTIGVHGHIEDQPATEEYRFSPGDAYQRTKLEAELWLRDFATESNLLFTIIRPASIYGPGDRRLLKFYKMVSRGLILMLGSGHGYYHLIHVDDLTNIMMISALRDNTLSETIIAANETHTSIIEMGKIISKALDKKAMVIRFPVVPFFWLADICKFICTPLGIQPPIYRRRVAFYTKDRMFDVSKLKTLINYQWNYDNDQGVTHTTNWYKQKGWLD